MAAAKKVACVEIGGIPISLATDDSTFFDLLSRRYEGYLSSSSPQCALEFEIVEAGPAPDEPVRVKREGAEWRIARGDFLARWDPRSGRGHVRQNANPYSLDSVVRILHSLILADQGGFLLHSASGICEGHACLFSGVSGAGKTTMTRLAPPDITLLTDEISYVRPGKNPDAAAYVAFGTPFAGELARPGENTKAPIAGLFFLEQGPENRIDEIPSGDAVRRLMRNILFFAEDPRLVEQLLATACDFVSRVPIRRLMFYPDCKVWDEVRRFVRDSSRRSVAHDRAQEGANAHV